MEGDCSDRKCGVMQEEVKPISQARKALTKARLDMDSNKSRCVLSVSVSLCVTYYWLYVRWTAAVKSAETDMTKADKADQRKEKYEDSTTEFTQAQVCSHITQPTAAVFLLNCHL